MQILSFLFLMNVVHGLLLSFVLLMNNLKKFNENFFLVSLLLIITGYQFKAFIVLEGHYTSFPHLISFFLPLHFLVGPLFYFYVLFVLNKDRQLKNRDALHLVPFIICFFTLLPFYVKSGAEKLTLHQSPAPGNFEMESSKIIYYGLIFVSAFFYCYKSLKLIREKSISEDKRSNKIYAKKIKWLHTYTRLFLFFLIVFLISQLLFVFTDFYQFYVMLATVFMSSIMIHYIVYWSIRESQITQKSSQKNKRILAFEDKVPELKQGVITILETEQKYLNPNLSTKYFCERLSVNSQYLSQLVNVEFSCNLSYLINSYRITHSKNLLLNPEFNHLNFSGIAALSGFNSANTFTRVFKQHTGITPREFKDNNSD